LKRRASFAGTKFGGGGKARAVKAILKIAKCFARHIIGQREIGRTMTKTGIKL